MAATYDDRLLTTVDLVRFYLGDTDVTDALVSDEHITAVLALRSTVPLAVAALATELVTRFGREPVKVRTNDGVMVDYSERIGVWRTLAESMTSGGGVAIRQVTYPVLRPPQTADRATRDWHLTR